MCFRMSGELLGNIYGDGEEDEARTVTEWAAWRARQIMNGELKSQTRGGNSIPKMD